MSKSTIKKINSIFIFISFTCGNLLVFFPSAKAAQDQWENITPSSVSGYILNDIATIGDLVFLATDHGVYRSDNKGADWQAIIGYSGNVNTVLVAAPFDSDLGMFNYDDNTYIYAGTNNGIYRTTLGVSNLELFSNGLSASPITDIETDIYKNVTSGGDISTIYSSVNSALTSEKGLYRSDDNGETWLIKNSNWPDENIDKLSSISDFGSFAYIYAVSDQNKLYYADMYSLSGADEDWQDRLIFEEAGTIFNDITANLTTSLAFLATSNGVFYGGYPDDIANWTAVNDGLTDLDVNTVACDYLDAKITYAATNGGGVYKSIDENDDTLPEWHQINNNLPAVNIKDIKTNPVSSNIVYAISETDLYILELSDPYNLPANSDIIAPEAISDLHGIDRTESSVDLSWTAPGDDANTGTAASYDIRYSLTPVTNETEWENAKSVSGPAPQTAGNLEYFTVGGLANGTGYYFYIKTIDDNSNISVISNEMWAETLDNPIDDQKPAITITMPTDQPAYATTSSIISLAGTADDNDNVAFVSWLNNRGGGGEAVGTSTWIINNISLQHGVNLISVTAEDNAGNMEYDTLSVTYTDSTPPIISSINVSNITTSGATISWTTDEDSDSKVIYGANTNYGSEIINTSTSTSHSLVIYGLSVDTTYHFHVISKDINGNAATSTDQTFKTANTSSGGGGGGGGGGGSAPSPTPIVINQTYNATPGSSQLIASATEATLIWKNPVESNFNKIIIYKSNEKYANYMSSTTIASLGEKIYEGTAESFLDKNLSPNLTYYYAIFAVNKNLQFSNPQIFIKSPVIKDNSQTSQNEEDIQEQINAGQYNNLAGLPKKIVEIVSLNEAVVIFENNEYVNLDDKTRRLYFNIIGKSPNSLEEKDKFAIAYYIHNGTPTTIILGAGERAGVLNSYLSAFSKLPTNELEWQDVIKIANGRWPEERNLNAENQAQNNWFVKVYKRKPVMSQTNDNAAVTVIAYGLRPRIRNLNSEKAAIKIFKAIFKENPVDATNWDIVRAIAYSGSTR